jgi:hypothetical protein
MRNNAGKPFCSSAVPIGEGSDARPGELRMARYDIAGYQARSVQSARDPGFAITTIMSLTLGLGASLAVFTVADSRANGATHDASLPASPSLAGEYSFIAGTVAPSPPFRISSAQSFSHPELLPRVPAKSPIGTPVCVC